jgi:hypothetical protein
MVFGMKKEKEGNVPIVPDEETPVDVGNYDMEPASDDDDDVSSVPPPPPGVKSTSEMFRDEESEATPAPTQDDGSQSPEPEGQNVSFITEPSNSYKMKDPNRRKKLLLILAAIATFCIFLGLTISYTRRNSNSSTVSSSAAADAGDGPFFDTGSSTNPIDQTDAPTLDDGTDAPTNGDATEDSTATDAPTDGDTEVSTATDAPTDGDTEGSTATASPTDGNTEDSTATDAPTDGVSEGGSDSGTEADSTWNDPNGTGGFDCVVDRMFASSSCEGGKTTATITMCVTDPIDDQFWSWIETPTQYKAVARNDWDWLRNGMTVDKVGIPPGYYEIGLYADGNSNLSEYPLITSTSFIIACA